MRTRLELSSPTVWKFTPDIGGALRFAQGGNALKQSAENCDPAFNNEAGECSATRLFPDAIVRKHLHLESRGRGRPWISPGFARSHRLPQRCSFCSLLPLALSRHDMKTRDSCDRAIV